MAWWTAVLKRDSNRGRQQDKHATGLACQVVHLMVVCDHEVGFVLMNNFVEKS